MAWLMSALGAPFIASRWVLRYQNDIQNAP